MKIGFLITARLKSTRLKLKLLLPLNGKTVMEHVIDRAKAVFDCDDIVLCTSKSNQDIPLVKIAHKNNIYYLNGHSEDVLKRLLDASTLFNFDFFIGITADNPLFSIYHANLIVDLIKRDPTLDFVYTSGLPIGVNIYGMSVKALKTVCAIKDQVDTEIWGPLINRPEIFNVSEIRGNWRIRRE
jgi:spore coat polysaccharide biosynthesis protein SpsF